MAISLKNHEDRIIELENRATQNLSDTGWINCNPTSLLTVSKYGRQIFRYRVLNGVVYLHIGCKIETNEYNAHLGTLPNWKYGEAVFDIQGFGDRGAVAEGRSVRVDSSGKMYYNIEQMSQWAYVAESVASYPLTIYYIVRYNIYKLMRFLSHLNTKFGGERR